MIKYSFFKWLRNNFQSTKFIIFKNILHKVPNHDSQMLDKNFFFLVFNPKPFRRKQSTARRASHHASFTADVDHYFIIFYHSSIIQIAANDGKK